MRIRLFFPPAFQMLSSYPSIYYLKGFLKRHGYGDVRATDLNVRYWHSIYRKYDRLAIKLAGKIDAIRSDGRIINDALLSLQDDVDKIGDDVSRALRYFCRNEIADQDRRLTDRYAQALDVAERLHKYFYPDDHIFTDGYFSSLYLNKLVASPDFPYSWFYDDQFRRMKRLRPDFIGISLIVHSQLIHAVAIARWSKKYFPDAHVCIGGPILTDVFLSPRCGEYTRRNVFKYVDSVVCYEGEHSIVELLEHIEGKRRRLPEYTNVVFRHRAQMATAPSPHRDLYEPDYSDLEFEKYFNYVVMGNPRKRRKVMNFLASRGCYWSKCRFCKSYMVYKDYSQCADLDNLVKVIRRCQTRFGLKYIRFNDEAVALPQIEKISKAILKNRLRVDWYTNMRVESSINKEICNLAAKSGMIFALIGLESGSQRVLDLMNKGIDLKTTEQMIRVLKKAGIGVQLYMMCYYPGETADDIRKSYEFIRRNRAFIHHFMWLDFLGHLNAPIFKTLKADQYYLMPRKYDLCTSFFLKKGPTREMRKWHARIENADIHMKTKRSVPKGVLS